MLERKPSMTARDSKDGSDELKSSSGSTNDQKLKRPAPLPRKRPASSAFSLVWNFSKPMPARLVMTKHEPVD